MLDKILSWITPLPPHIIDLVFNYIIYGNFML